MQLFYIYLQIHKTPHHMKTKTLLVVLLLFFGQAQAQSKIQVGEKAPEIYVSHWIKNEPADKSLSNKYIVLEFWATWCGPCIDAVPHMNELQKEFAQEDLYFISMSYEPVAKIEKTLKRVDFHSIVTTDTSETTQRNFGDGEGKVASYPMAVLIDNGGIIRWKGNPRDLNQKIMKRFLSNQSSKVKEEDKKEEAYQDKVFKGFIELATDKSTNYYYRLGKSKSKRPSGNSIGSVVGVSGATLAQIYAMVFDNKNVEIPEQLKKVHFDLYYKNTKDSSTQALDHLEANILQQLQLSKQEEERTAPALKITVKNRSLLEENYEFSAVGGSEKKLVFTAYSFEMLAKKLSKDAPVIVLYEGNDTKKYNFIINLSSKEALVKSLKSYGIETEESEAVVKHIKLDISK